MQKNCNREIKEIKRHAVEVIFVIAKVLGTRGKGTIIQYFPRNSTDAFAGSKLRPYQSLSEMRDQLTKVVMDDYSVNRFSDWPRFDYLGDFVTWADLWQGTPASAQYTAIIFENHQASLTGAQLLLDLHKKRDRLLVRRCLKNHPLADALRLTDFPSLAIFKRADKKPILVVELRRLLLAELEGFLSGSAESALPTSQGVSPLMSLHFLALISEYVQNPPYPNLSEYAEILPKKSFSL
ncbi:hypothetical protein TELCIR_04947 [Teladorsagia circumcincta]|uniref:Uncharacterized protein n=1 Tax=Teladorsagia circumcincta TaxID=45464 RepID=A0A2G9USI4_TELCI|nr:hypothetical protein TELCIR_04947 [Teladorsagia circumcincta]